MFLVFRTHKGQFIWPRGCWRLFRVGTSQPMTHRGETADYVIRFRILKGKTPGRRPAVKRARLGLEVLVWPHGFQHVEQTRMCVCRCPPRDTRSSDTQEPWPHLGPRSWFLSIILHSKELGLLRELYDSRAGTWERLRTETNFYRGTHQPTEKLIDFILISVIYSKMLLL